MWICVLSFLFLYFVWKSLYWNRQGLPATFPLPFFGDGIVCWQKGIFRFYKDLYSSSTGPVVGFHLFTRPILMIRDPNIISRISIRDFDKFPGHGMYTGKGRDPLTKSVFHTTRSEWKTARSALVQFLTPSYIDSVLSKAEPFLLELIEDLKSSECIEIKQKISKFTSAVTVAMLGLNTDPLDDNSQLHSLTQTSRTSQVALVSFVSPFLFDLFRLTSYPLKANDFMRKATRAAVDSGGQTPDFIQAMKKLITKGLGMDSITGQSLIMYVGGVESTANTIAFCFYELARNPSIQDRIRFDPQYLDNVIMETARKYPVFGVVTRECCQKYRIPGTLTTIEPGTLVAFPVAGIHYDSKYFPDPDKFDPDRFSASSPVADAFLAFGVGPRQCLGKRLFLAIAKTVITRLLKEFEFSLPSDQPLLFDRNSFLTASKRGIMLNVMKYKTLCEF